MSFREAAHRHSAPDQVTDLVNSVKQYARQETVDPIRGAARWVAVGTIASVSLGLSLVFFSLAILRLSQYLGGDTLSASWSFVHYFFTFIVVAACVALSLSRIQQRSLNKEKS
jgi:hypothetical protein